jgi:hypothetical protein
MQCNGSQWTVSYETARCSQTEDWDMKRFFGSFCRLFWSRGEATQQEWLKRNVQPPFAYERVRCERFSCPILGTSENGFYGFWVATIARCILRALRYRVSVIKEGKRDLQTRNDINRFSGRLHSGSSTSACRSFERPTRICAPNPRVHFEVQSLNPRSFDSNFENDGLRSRTLPSELFELTLRKDSRRSELKLIVF